LETHPIVGVVDEELRSSSINSTVFAAARIAWVAAMEERITLSSSEEEEAPPNASDDDKSSICVLGFSI
jgi:hypothetical protein